MLYSVFEDMVSSGVVGLKMKYVGKINNNINMIKEKI
jgi:hypothetical protein